VRTPLRKMFHVGVVTILLGGLGATTASSAFAAPGGLSPEAGPAAGGTVVQIPEPSTAKTRIALTEVSAGTEFVLGLGSDGNMYAWGTNLRWQFGNGTDKESAVPVYVPTPAGVKFTKIGAGSSSGVALGSDGKTYQWGNKHFAGGPGSSPVPEAVNTPVGVTFTDVSSRGSFALAQGSDGNTYAWGTESNGELGIGTDIVEGNGPGVSTVSPTKVHAPTGVTFTKVSAGSGYALALGDDGYVYSWGSNWAGQLGEGTNIPSNVPTRVHTPAGVSFVGLSAGHGHSLAVTADGEVWAWGENVAGELGNGTSRNRFTEPVKVHSPAGVKFRTVTTTRIGLGGTSVGITADGDLYGWGSGAMGQLGDEDVWESVIPRKIPAPPGVTFTSVDAGASYLVAIGSDGRTYSWGANFEGQLGNGTTTESFAVGPTNELPKNAVITEVSFGGIPGTKLSGASGKAWEVTTPAHRAGPVDVKVVWTLNGVKQPPVTHRDGFTYQEGPTTTSPADVSAVEGTTATFTVAASGYPTPTVRWEVSLDRGKTWRPAADDTAVKVSSDGLSVKTTAKKSLNQSLYRAIASNSVGESTSKPARLTVTSAGTGTKPGDPGTPGKPGTVGKSNSSKGLAATGMPEPTWLLTLGLAGVLVGGVTVIAGHVSRRRRTSTAQ